MSPIAPAGCPGGPVETPTPGTTCPDGSAPRDPAVDSALADWLHLEDEAGHPLVAYDIGCDEGGATEFMRKLWCAAQALPFTAGKWFVGVGTGIMEWALGFELTETVSPVAGLLSRVYQTSLIGPIDIVHLAWVVTLLVGGWAVMRGQLSSGIREVFTTFLIAILGTIMLTNPEGYLEGSSTLARNTSGAVLEAVDGALGGSGGGGEGDPGEVRQRLSRIMERSFVAEPYDLINWGEPLRGDCAAARDRILSQGPWGSHPQPREVMREAGCEARADYNAEPTDNRAMASVTVAVAAGLVTLLLVSLALAVFIAQVTLILLFAGASLVWTVALFPGARSVLWWWISRLVWAVLVTVTAMFLLSWVAVTVTVILDNTSDISIVQRSFVIVLVAAVAYRMRSAIDRGLEGAGTRLAATLGWAASGTNPPGPAAPATPARGSSLMSTSPVAMGAAAGLGALHNSQRAVKGSRQVAGRATTAARAGATAGQATDRGVRTVGRRVADAGRATVMAPVVLPQRIGEARAGRQAGPGTARSSQVRERMAQARETRSQWARNVRHPVQATRDARRAAEQGRPAPYDWM